MARDQRSPEREPIGLNSSDRAPKERSTHGRSPDEVGPPWILGHRGAPNEAPENTLVSLGRALDAGLDGIEYDLQRCATGEAVLLHDETLERTTNGTGPVEERTLPELASLDAGSWFHRDFVGEPLPLLEEALAAAGPDPGHTPLHMIELKDPRLVPVVAEALAGLERPLPVRIASFHRSVCLEARDQGLASMLLGVAAHEGDRRFVRDERIAAYGVAADGWRTVAGESEDWSCERWAWSVDDPDDLLEACRRPLFGFNTNEPSRALAVRRLVRLTPKDTGPYPLRAPKLEVAPGALRAARGEWCGRWEALAAVRNPFEWSVEVELDVELRGGAYEVRDLPQALTLEPGCEETVEFGLVGGSWSPGADPRLVADYRWSGSQQLELDVPLARIRTLALGEGPRRLELLREGPDDPPATMVVRRRGRWLVCSIENDGQLVDAQALVHLGGETRYGARGVRVPLAPELFQRGIAAGPEVRTVPFSCGFRGREEGPRGSRMRVRRWSGGLPAGLGSGAPGRLIVRGRG